jgi:DNA-binding MarR family transcriptional regulator
MSSLSFLIADNARLLRAAFERRIAQAGLSLTPGEARALLNIAAADGSRQLDIAARMGVEPMTLCAYLDKLQVLGLIERQPCIADRRAKRINLTESSQEMIDALRQELNVILAQATEGLDEKTKEVLWQALASVHTNLQVMNSTQQPQLDANES